MSDSAELALQSLFGQGTVVALVSAKATFVNATSAKANEHTETHSPSQAGMAYEPRGTVPRIEESEIVPHYFPGLRRDGDAVAPAVKSFESKIDLQAVVKMVSPDLAKQTISNRFVRAISTLKSAYNTLVEVMGPASPNWGQWPESDVYAKCAELEPKAAGELERAYRLVVEMPPSAVSFVSWANDRCGTRMIVTKSFLLSFVVEFVHTADAYRLKADLKSQYLANDAATAGHVQGLVQRHIANAGSQAQHAALEGTGVAPDAAPDAGLLAASILSSPAVTTASQANETTTAIATQTSLLAMIPEGQARTNAVLALLKKVDDRLDQEQAQREERLDREHERKLRVYDAEKDAIDAKRKREEADFKTRVEERSHEKKQRVIETIERSLRECAADDDARRKSLAAKMANLSHVPTNSSVFVVNPQASAPPRALQQQVFDTTTSAIELRFHPGMSYVDLEMEQRLTIQNYVSLFYKGTQLSNSELGRIGKAVAKYHPNTPLRTFNGKHAVNAYFVRDLLGEPLCSVIDAEIKGILEERKRKDADHKAQGAGIDQFVVVGRRV